MNGSRFLWWLAAALLVAMLSATMSLPVLAHLDKPGNPAIRVTVYLKSVTLKSDQDDGLDFNAEVVVLWILEHKGHDGASGILAINDFNWDDGDTRDVGKKVYEHIECSPVNDIQFQVEVKEDDTDTITTIVGGIVAVVGGVVSTALSTGTALVVAGIAGAGGLTSLFASINSADDLGRGMKTVNGEGVYEIDTGRDGAIVRFEVKVEEVPGMNCEPQRPTTTATTTTPEPTYTATPVTETTTSVAMNTTEETLRLAKRSLNERLREGTGYFEELRRIIMEAMEVNPEPGNPGGITEEELEYIRRVLPRTILLEILDPWLVIIVKMGTDVSNASELSLEAMGHLYRAEGLAASGAYLDSVAEYELAWMKALTAIFTCTSQTLVGESTLRLIVVNESMEPVEGVFVDLYRDGELVTTMESTGEPSIVPLEPGFYTIKARTWLLGLDLNLASLPVEVRGPTEATIVVSTMLVPVEWIPLTGNIVAALLLGLIASSILARPGYDGKPRAGMSTRVIVGIIVVATVFMALQALAP